MTKQLRVNDRRKFKRRKARKEFSEGNSPQIPSEKRRKNPQKTTPEP